jgi:ankyrin repeat protein
MTTLAHEILCAAGSGDAKAVREYLATGVPVDTANELGYTALMSAARSYRIELVDWLIENGADVNAITTDGQSVLHAAVGETPSQPDRQGACVASLLIAGAKPDVQTPVGHSPLMQAAWFGCVNAVKSLLAHNSDINLKDQQGKTAAEIAASRGHDGIRQILTQAHKATATKARDSG